MGTQVQPRKKRGLPLAAAEDEEEPGGGEGCRCQTLIVAVCQTLDQRVKQLIDSLQRMENRMNSETFTGFVTNQPTSLLLPLLVGPPFNLTGFSAVFSHTSQMVFVIEYKSAQNKSLLTQMSLPDSEPSLSYAGFCPQAVGYNRPAHLI